MDGYESLNTPTPTFCTWWTNAVISQWNLWISINFESTPCFIDQGQWFVEKILKIESNLKKWVWKQNDVLYRGCASQRNWNQDLTLAVKDQSTIRLSHWRSKAEMSTFRMRSEVGRQSTIDMWDSRSIVKVRSMCEIREGFSKSERSTCEIWDRSSKSYRCVSFEICRQSPLNVWDLSSVVKVRSMCEIPERSSKSDRWETRRCWSNSEMLVKIQDVGQNSRSQSKSKICTRNLWM